MSENERSLDDVLRELRAEYNPPPETPREEMWQAVRAGLGSREAEVVELVPRRASPSSVGRRVAGWGVAAAALLVLGIGIGRVSAPSPPEQAPPVETAVATEGRASVLRAAALQHLEGSETLLTGVRSDARSGELDPRLGVMARGMLMQTRLFLDASDGVESELRRLLEDLELVLAQVVAVSGGEDGSGTELDLALRGLDDREVLARIRTLSGPAFAGT